MKGLALEYIVQWIILLTVAMIVISMVIYFSDDIKRFLARQTKESKVTPHEIKKDYFSSGEILTYVFSCWDKTGEKYREDATCFYLFGDFSKVDKAWVEDKFKERYPGGIPRIDLRNFDTSKSYAKVVFKEWYKAIVVEN
ncbi:MAG: hypothetical protein ACO2OO_00565 [Candidatus Aenigmatarchaeota archaeon]|jgi:hypothetical protein